MQCSLTRSARPKLIYNKLHSPAATTTAQPQLQLPLQLLLLLLQLLLVLLLLLQQLLHLLHLLVLLPTSTDHTLNVVCVVYCT
jgi:hypothetical protein